MTTTETQINFKLDPAGYHITVDGVTKLYPTGTYTRLDGALLRRLIRTPGLAVYAHCRKGCRDRMPRILAPGYHVYEGPEIVMAVTKTNLRCKAGDSWIDIDALVFDFGDFSENAHRW